MYVMGFLGTVPSSQTLRIIWFLSKKNREREERRTVRTTGDIQNITVSAENELIPLTGSGIFQPCVIGSRRYGARNRWLINSHHGCCQWPRWLESCMVHESLLSMDFALPTRMGPDRTTWLAAVRAPFMLLRLGLDHLPGAFVWTDIHKHVRAQRNTHSQNGALPLTKQRSPAWLCQVDGPCERRERCRIKTFYLKSEWGGDVKMWINVVWAKCKRIMEDCVYLSQKKLVGWSD